MTTPEDKLAQSVKRMALEALLRDPCSWPEGFIWNFRDLQHCGMGLAQRAGIVTPLPGREIVASLDMEEALGISTHNAYRIFLNFEPVAPAAWNSPTVSRFYYGKDGKDVTPTDVADAMQRLLA